MFSGERLPDYHFPMTQSLFSNKHFDVQQIQQLCSFSSVANCGVALAIRYGSSVFIIDTRQGDTKFKQASPNIDGVDYSSTPTIDKNKEVVFYNHNFKFPEGSNIIVSLFPNYGTNRTFYHLNVQIWIAPSHFMSTKSGQCEAAAYKNGGACGSLVSKPGILQTRDGPVSFDKHRQVQISWMVPAGQNLFKEEWTSSVPEWRSMFKDVVPGVSNGVTLKSRGLELELYRRVAAPLPFENQPISSFREISNSEALDYCTKQIIGGDCKSVVEPRTFIENCVDDAILTGSFSMAIDDQHAFLQSCIAVTNLLIRSGNETQIALGRNIQISNGLNDNDCPSGCSSNVCGSLGCVCSEERYGTFCEFLKLKNQ
jgi:hypothetical protein